MRTCVSFLILFVALGCVHVDPKGAPGVIDVHAPPAKIEDARTEVPEDPGQDGAMMTLGYSLMFGATGAGPGRQAPDFVFHPTIEASIFWFTRDRSYIESTRSDFTLEIFRTLPKGGPRSQLNLGWTPYEIRSRDGGPGPIYAEWQHGFFGPEEREFYPPLALAAGYSVVPMTWAHGPQITATGLYGLISVRAAYLFGGGWYAGLTLNGKFPVMAWLWSQ